MVVKYSEISIPVGETEIKAKVPNVINVVEPQYFPSVKDTRAEISRAIKNPIGSKRLRDIARGKKDVAIVVNDITRPYPGGLIVEEIAAELNEAEIKDEHIFLVLAYGYHRINTHEELVSMFGEDVVRRFRIVHHRATEPDCLKTVGVTPRGVKVEINKEFAEAQVKIATGCITPHQLAGFSGGRKSIMPGIAGINSLKTHHSFPIRPRVSSMGWLKGNPFHEEALAAARIAGVDFIVNTVENDKREVVRCVAGDLDAAHSEGVQLCREIWTVNVPSKPNVVIVSPGGYPRDIDLHQSQKAVGCAEMICKEGGQIILCAEMRDGIGKPGQVLSQASSPEEVITRFEQFGFSPDAVSKAYMWARAVQSFRISIACSKIPNTQIESMFFEAFDTLDEAIESALHRYGDDAEFVVIPHASEVIPVISTL